MQCVCVHNILKLPRASEDEIQFTVLNVFVTNTGEGISSRFDCFVGLFCFFYCVVMRRVHGKYFMSLLQALDILLLFFFVLYVVSVTNCLSVTKTRYDHSSAVRHLTISSRLSLTFHHVSRKMGKKTIPFFIAEMQHRREQHQQSQTKTWMK